MLSVATSASPLGPFVDVSDRPVFDFGYAAIDATVFIDDDGTPYMLYAKDCSENIVDGVHTSQIWGVRLSEDLMSVKGDPILLLTPSGPFETKDPSWQWNEGPAVLKHMDRYYVSYSVNCYTDPEYSVCYAVSDHPLGPYTKASENPILAKIHGVFSGPGHNMYFRSTEGKLMTAFHIHTDMERPSGDRTTCLAPVSFDNHGKLIIEIS
jgi:beta-xylosidase